MCLHTTHYPLNCYLRRAAIGAQLACRLRLVGERVVTWITTKGLTGEYLPQRKGHTTVQEGREAVCETVGQLIARTRPLRDGIYLHRLGLMKPYCACTVTEHYTTAEGYTLICNLLQFIYSRHRTSDQEYEEHQRKKPNSKWLGHWVFCFNTKWRIQN